LSGALIRTIHRPIRPVQRIQPTEFLIVRLHPIVNAKNVFKNERNEKNNIYRYLVFTVKQMQVIKQKFEKNFI